MTFAAMCPESCSNSMLYENLIKEPLISDSDPTTESQNHVALQFEEGKLGELYSSLGEGSFTWPQAAARY